MPAGSTADALAPAKSRRTESDAIQRTKDAISETVARDVADAVAVGPELIGPGTDDTARFEATMEGEPGTLEVPEAEPCA